MHIVVYELWYTLYEWIGKWDVVDYGVLEVSSGYFLLFLWQNGRWLPKPTYLNRQEKEIIYMVSNYFVAEKQNRTWQPSIISNFGYDYFAERVREKRNVHLLIPIAHIMGLKSIAFCFYLLLLENPSLSWVYDDNNIFVWYIYPLSFILKQMPRIINFRWLEKHRGQGPNTS